MSKCMFSGSTFFSRAVLYFISSVINSVDENCQQLVSYLRNPGRDISFPIFARKEVETKRIGKEIKTILSRLNDLSTFFSNIEQNRN